MTNPHRNIFALAAGLALALPGLANGAEANWPNWRGTNENGSTASGSYIANFDNEKNVKWKTELPAKGCSTPIVWKDQIIITSPSDGRDSVIAFDWNLSLIHI